MSRSQVSQQVVYLLQQTGKLGATTSALESSEPVENFLASGLTFPIAVVETLDADIDDENPGRIEVARFRISVAGHKVTEALTANYPASGGSGSSQHSLENTARDLVAGLSTVGGIFSSTEHGFQGRIASIGTERLVVAQGTTFVVCDIDLEVYDCTFADNYDAPRRFVVLPGASHTVTMTWTNPPARFDQYQNVVRRGTSAGDAAPTSPTGGTGVTVTGGVLGTSATDTLPGAGLKYNYALVRTYNTGANYSSAQTYSVTTT